MSKAAAPGWIQDTRQRFGEGWQLRWPADGRTRVGRLRTAPSPFANDEEAAAYVVRRAEDGSEYHQAVVAFLVKRRLGLV